MPLTPNKFPGDEYKRIHKEYSTLTTATRLTNWFNYMDKLFVPEHGVSQYYKVLLQLRPELQDVDVKKSTNLIYDIMFYPKRKNMTARILLTCGS